jgi:DNA-3-methyladenine glycosylase II
VLAGLIADRPGFDPRRWLTELPPMDLFGALVFQIVGQQLSVTATRRTLERIEARFGGHLPSAVGLDHLPAEEEVLAIAEKWRPYRSLATAYLFSAAFEEARALAAEARPESP